jgi:hypothetical protein
MRIMAEYDCEMLPHPKQIAGTYYTRSEKTWDPWHGCWHDGRPEGCRYPDCVLIHRRFRDGRPPRQCPVVQRKYHITGCKHIEAQKEWRKQYREKRLMARLDRFLRDQEPLADLARPAPFLSHEDYIKMGATPIYRDGKVVGYQWDSPSQVSGFVDTIDDQGGR